MDQGWFDTSLVGMLIYTFWVICLIAFGGSRDQQSQASSQLIKQMQLIIMVPAMNEAGVIGTTIERFLTSTVGISNIKMAIIDDGPDDSTGQVVKRIITKEHCEQKVQLLSRSLPNAQQGKGSALNWAYHRVINTQTMNYQQLNRTIIGVLDADAYMERQGYESVLADFAAQPSVDLLQTRVAMITTHNWLQLFQDIEFGVINHWIQNTRNRINNAAASGNGQFVRAIAINSYNPWGNALLEDFEFSTRFLLRGRQTLYAGGIVVYQQAIDHLKPFIRQRARWTQGGLDCLFTYWPRIIRSSRIHFLAKVEMTFYMFIPFITLVSGVAGLYVFIYVAIHITIYLAVFISLILLNCIINTIIISAYQKAARTKWFISLAAILFLGIYNYLLYPAIIIAFYKKIRGQHGWAKTVHGQSNNAV